MIIFLPRPQKRGRWSGPSVSPNPSIYPKFYGIPDSCQADVQVRTARTRNPPGTLVVERPDLSISIDDIRSTIGLPGGSPMGPCPLRIAVEGGAEHL